jgi:hypothetical protein
VKYWFGKFCALPHFWWTTTVYISSFVGPRHPLNTIQQHLLPASILKKDAKWRVSVKAGGICGRQVDPWRWDRQVVPKRQFGTTTIRCVKSQKSADLIYIKAEAWNHAHSSPHGLFLMSVHLHFSHDLSNWSSPFFSSTTFQNFSLYIIQYNII